RRTHCTQFAAARCTFTPIDGGTGWRLHCRDGVADPACGARPVCGDGVRDPGEECDGAADCDACTQLLSSCCERGGACIPAFAFGLYDTLLQYCYSALGFGPDTIRGRGLVCGSGGACVDEPIEPTPVCCQQQETVCSDSVQTSLGGLWSARHD